MQSPLTQINNNLKVLNQFQTSFSNHTSRLLTLQSIISNQVYLLKQCKTKCKNKLFTTFNNLKKQFKYFSQDLKNQCTQICEQFINISTKICVVFIQQMMKIQQQKAQWKKKYFQLQNQNKLLKQFINTNLQNSQSINYQNSQMYGQNQSQEVTLQNIQFSQFQSQKKVSAFDIYEDVKNISVAQNILKLSNVNKQYQLQQQNDIKSKIKKLQKQQKKQKKYNDQQSVKVMINNPIKQLFQQKQINSNCMIKNLNENQYKKTKSIQSHNKNENSIMNMKNLKGRHHRNHSSSYTGQYSSINQPKEQHALSIINLNSYNNESSPKFHKNEQIVSKNKNLTKVSSRSQNINKIALNNQNIYKINTSNYFLNIVNDRSLQRLINTRNKTKGQWQMRQGKKNKYGCIRSSLNKFMKEKGLKT